ncbi:Transposase [Streptococcus gordonii]|uniref:Transposase n=1 Tax=Streptococcus gordonii TaxID=1302 RepID=A0A139MX67_STRGN|nr:Transposase [Streptococcus gordonii]
MHIHYNTNQTTLPLEIASFLPQDHVVFTIKKAVNDLPAEPFQKLYHELGRPSYHPKNDAFRSSVCLFSRRF